MCLSTWGAPHYSLYAYVQGWPGSHMCTVFGWCLLGDFPATNGGIQFLANPAQQYLLYILAFTVCCTSTHTPVCL